VLTAGKNTILNVIISNTELKMEMNGNTFAAMIVKGSICENTIYKKSLYIKGEINEIIK